MATRTSIPGSKSGATDSISVAEFNDLPGGLIAYAEITADQGSITTPVDLTSLTLTLTPNASRILWFIWKMNVQPTSGSDAGAFAISLLKDGSALDSSLHPPNPNASQNFQAQGFAIDIGPTNASHTYKLQGSRNGSSTNTFTVKASSTQPGWLAIFDMAPSF